MKIDPLLRLALAVFLGGATTASAHEHAPAKPGAAEPHHDVPAEHEHPTPHGGQVVTIDDVHAEVLFADAGVTVWFFDMAMKPLAPPTDGKLTLTAGKDVKKVDLKMDAKTPDRVVATAAVPKDGIVDVLVQATVAGKPRTVKVVRALVAGSPTTLKEAVAMMDAAHHELAAIVKDGDLSKAHMVADRLKTLGAGLPALATKAGLGADDVKELTIAGKKIGLLFSEMDEAGDGGKRDDAQKVFVRYDALIATIRTKAALAPAAK